MNIQCDRCQQRFQSGISFPHPVQKGQTFDLCGNCCSYVADAGKHPLNYGTPPTLASFVQGQAAEIQNLKGKLAAMKANFAAEKTQAPQRYTFQTAIPSGWAETKQVATPSFTAPAYAPPPPNSFGTAGFPANGHFGATQVPFGGSTPTTPGFGFGQQLPFPTAGTDALTPGQDVTMSSF